MPISRRSFVHALGAGAAGSLLAPFVSGRGLEALTRRDGVAPIDTLLSAGTIRLDANENPNGPGQVALDAITAMFSETSRYPRQSSASLHSALAKALGVREENIVLGCGSTDILRAAVTAFTTPDRALVVGSPTFENPAGDADRIGTHVRAIPVTPDLRLDLDGMAKASGDAGLVYLCNPNNPTSTVHGASAVKDFVARVLSGTPDATILIDEAYHDYVDDPSYATAIPLALENPRILVARTFSKVYGMAGLRVGYAVGAPRTIAALGRHTLMLGVNQLGAAAALASVADVDHVNRERALNRASRDFTVRALTTAGFAPAASQANFIMVDLKRNAKAFRDGCRQNGVSIGRPFPPLDNYARISIGTMDEMRQAVDVFRRVLATA